MKDIKPVRKINYSDLQNALEATEVMPSPANTSKKTALSQPKTVQPAQAAQAQAARVAVSTPQQTAPEQAAPVQPRQSISNQAPVVTEPTKQSVPVATAASQKKKAPKARKTHFDFIHHGSKKKAATNQPAQPQATVSGMDGMVRPQPRTQQRAPTTAPSQPVQQQQPHKLRSAPTTVSGMDGMVRKPRPQPAQSPQSQPQEPVNPTPLPAAPSVEQIHEDMAQFDHEMPKEPRAEQEDQSRTPKDQEDRHEMLDADSPEKAEQQIETSQVEEDSHVHKFKEEDDSHELPQDPHIHSLLESLQGGDLDSIADSMLETDAPEEMIGEEEVDQTEQKPEDDLPIEQDDPELPEINLEKRRNDNPSNDTARPPLAKKSEKIIAPPSQENPTPEEHEEQEEPEITKAADGPMTNAPQPQTLPHPAVQNGQQKLEAIKTEGGSQHSGNMHDSENYQIPIKPTKHHRKNDFVVWFFYTIASLSALSLAVLLVMALIS